MKYAQYELLTNLRGFAALLVVFSHASNAGLYAIPGADFSGSGRYGVYLFFLLSAFLLTSQLDTLLSQKRSFKRLFIVYLTHRITRIYPLFLVMLLVYLLAYWTVGAPRYINGLMDFIEHVFLLDGDGIFWTIPVEFKFYFLLPFIVLMKVKLQPRQFYFLILSVVVSFSFFVPVYNGSLYPFVGVFCLGSLMFYIHKKKVSYLYMYPYFIISVVAFFLIIPAAYKHVFGIEITRGFFHSFVMLHCVLFFPWIYLCANKSKLANIFNFNLLKKSGDISFSLYLIHPLILLVFRTFVGDNWPQDLQFVAFLITTLSVSYISWEFIEVRLRSSSLVKKGSYLIAKNVGLLIFYILGRVQQNVFK